MLGISSSLSLSGTVFHCQSCVEIFGSNSVQDGTIIWYSHYTQATSALSWVENKRTTTAMALFHKYLHLLEYSGQSNSGINSENFLKCSESFLKYLGQSNLGIIFGQIMALKSSNREFCNSWYKLVNIYLLIYLS